MLKTWNVPVFLFVWLVVFFSPGRGSFPSRVYYRLGRRVVLQFSRVAHEGRELVGSFCFPPCDFVFTMSLKKVRCFERNQIKPFELTRKNQTAGGYMPSSILIHRIDKSVQFRPFRYLKRVTKSMGDSIDRNKANTILFFKKLWFAIPRLSTWFKLVSIT